MKRTNNILMRYAKIRSYATRSSPVLLKRGKSSDSSYSDTSLRISTRTDRLFLLEKSTYRKEQNLSGTFRTIVIIFGQCA